MRLCVRMLGGGSEGKREKEGGRERDFMGMSGGREKGGGGGRKEYQVLQSPGRAQNEGNRRS